MFGRRSARRRATGLARPASAARRPSLVERLEGRTLLTTAYALDAASNLVRFDTASPGTIAATTPVTGVAAGESLVGIDVRPQNGFLYGLGVNATADTATLYAISARTGVAGAVGTVGSVAFTTDGTTPVDLPDPATAGYGFDFNPAADRVRVTTGTGLNFRVNPNTGAGVDGDNTGLTSGNVTGTNPDGAINGGSTSVSAAAYTNNQPNNGGVTTLYTLDDASNALFVQNPANTGTQTLGQPVTFNGNPLDFSAVNGFDLPAGVNAPASNTPVASGSGFASLTVGGVTSLYAVNLVNGQATLVGTIGTGATSYRGLALQSAAGLPAIALSADGANLLRFNTNTPGTVTTQALATGSIAPGETLAGIDFRPQTGQLYGLGVNGTTNTATLYLVDPQSGALSAVGAAGQVTFTTDGTTPVDLPDPAAAGYGFDFNPTVDRVRVTTSTGLNFRANPANGAPVDGNNGGVAVSGTNPDGAVNGGPTGASAAAYTNSYGQSLSGNPTTLYTLDSVGNQLLIQNPPNAGTQTAAQPVTLNGSPLDFGSINGFDIPAGVAVTTANAPAGGYSFAVLGVGASAGLYRIELSNGQATFLGTIGAGTTVMAGLALGDSGDQVVVPAVSVGDVTVAEGSAGPHLVAVPVTLSFAAPFAVTVNYATADGSATVADGDYFPATGTVTFAPGTTSATINVPVNGDFTFEGDESFVVNLSNPVAGPGGSATISDAQATVNLTNDDSAVPLVSVNDVTQAEGNAGQTAFTFTVTRFGGDLNTTSAVDYFTTGGTALGGSDYQSASGSLTFLPGQTTRAVTVYVNGDKSAEATEAFALNLAAPFNLQVADGEGTGTIVNDDAAAPAGKSYKVNDVTVTEGNSGTKNLVFTVTRTGDLSAGGSVQYHTASGSAASGSDYVGKATTTLTFAPGQATRTVTIQVKGDTLYEADEQFTLKLSNPTGGATIADGTGVGTIKNDDAAPALSVNDVVVTEGNSGTRTLTFTVKLSKASGRSATVRYATVVGTANETDYVAKVGTLTFAAGQTSKTVTVTIKGDTKKEADETLFLNLFDAGGATIGDAQGKGTIKNDD